MRVAVGRNSRVAWVSVILTQGIVAALVLVVALTPSSVAQSSSRADGETGLSYQLTNNSTGAPPTGPAWTGPVNTGGPVLGGTAPDGITPEEQGASWWYGTVASSSFSENAYSIYYNITVPQAGTGGDSEFTLASAFDSNLGYDQMGLGSGQYDVNDPPYVYAETGAPCNGVNAWCAVFSIQTQSYESECFYAPYYQWEYGPLLNGISYEFEMTFSGQQSGTLAAYVYYMGPTNSHTLVNSFTFLTGGAYFSVAQLGGCYNAGYDFTDYEEIHSLNSVEAWPAYNYHSEVAVLPVSGTKQIPWTALAACGTSCPPSNFPGQYTTSYTSGQNVVTIQNQPFLAAISTNFGHGESTITLHQSNLPTSFYVPIDPMADPTGGYDVFYEYNYCSLPSGQCGDVGFNPGDAIVQPWSSNWHTAGNMTVTLPKPFTVGSYVMNLYACSNSNCGISAWVLVITS